MSIQVSYKKQFTFFLIMLILFLVIIEISIRIFEYSEDYCAEWSKESQVFKNNDPQMRKQICLDLNAKSEKYDVIRLESPDQHFPTLNINSDGFRGPEISKEKPDEVYRIFVIGGSTTFGYGATSDETTIPGFLQKFFDEYDFNFHVEVINAGVEAAYSSVESYYIRNIILEFEPDLIIAYGGLNDVGDVSIIKNVQTSDVTFDIRQILFYRTPFFLYDSLGLYPDNEDVFSNLDEDFISKRTNMWKGHWSDICKLGKENKFKTIVTVQPMLGTGDKILSSHELSLLSNHQTQINIMNKGLNELAKNLNELEEECSTTGDLRNVFDGIDEPIYYDFAHMSDFGNKIIAKNLFDLSLSIVEEKDT